MRDAGGDGGEKPGLSQPSPPRAGSRLHYTLTVKKEQKELKRGFGQDVEGEGGEEEGSMWPKNERSRETTGPRGRARRFALGAPHARASRSHFTLSDVYESHSARRRPEGLFLFPQAPKAPSQRDVQRLRHWELLLTLER